MVFSLLGLIIAKHFTIRAWVNRSERLQGEPLYEMARPFIKQAGIHFGRPPPIPLKYQFDRHLKP
jgi:hypothetical protein